VFRLNQALGFFNSKIYENVLRFLLLFAKRAKVGICH